jgi:hypothetical protein
VELKRLMADPELIKKGTVAVVEKKARELPFVTNTILFLATCYCVGGGLVPTLVDVGMLYPLAETSVTGVLTPTLNWGMNSSVVNRNIVLLARALIV